MGKSAPAAPPTPDYVGAAQAQGQANKETAIAQGYINNPNVYGPTGSQVVTFGANNQPTITQSLTPTAQATFEAQQRVQKALSNLGEQGIGTAQSVLGKAFQPTVGALQTQLDTSNLAQMPVNAGTTGQEAILSRLEPTLTRRSNQLEQTLANQGLTLGGEAYRNAKLDEARAQNDLLSQAALQGIGLDTSARAQGFNEAQNQMAAQNAAVQQELQRQAYMRQQPLNEITGLMSGSQIQMPSFQGYQPAQITPPPIMQGALAQGQSAMDQYGIQSANYNAGNAGLYNLAGTGGMIGAKYFGLIP
jgi:hypothetical protein